MPRIYTSVNDPLDFCRKCFPAEDKAYLLYGNDGDGSDGRGNCFSYNDDHPDYDECDYKCEKCNAQLISVDN